MLSRRWFNNYTIILIVVLIVIIITSCGSDGGSDNNDTGSNTIDIPEPDKFGKSLVPGSDIIDLPDYQYPDVLRWCTGGGTLYAVTHLESHGGGSVAIVPNGCVDGVPK